MVLSESGQWKIQIPNVRNAVSILVAVEKVLRSKLSIGA